MAASGPPNRHLTTMNLRRQGDSPTPSDSDIDSSAFTWHGATATGHAIQINGPVSVGLDEQQKRAEDRRRQRIEILRKLCTSPYQDRKERNPDRLEGTCEWFTSHKHFEEWNKQKASGLLWVSADPGSGKSVLARYLVNEVLPSTLSRITCYFFFKDEFEDQRNATGALQCILHQIFSQKEELFTDEIAECFHSACHYHLNSINGLWDIIRKTCAAHSEGEMMFVFDGLDECDLQSQTLLLTKTNITNLKVLVTSRPYDKIRQHFLNLGSRLETIHLRGEGGAEIENISKEISIFIKESVKTLSRTRQLKPDEARFLVSTLSKAENRTYLWVSLAFEVIQELIKITKKTITEAIESIPTVDAAYEKILNRSRHPGQTRRLLHIILGASRPLTIKEMSIALAMEEEPGVPEDVDREPLERFEKTIRELCGLFVTIIKDRVYLLHDTAKEFLRGSGPRQADARFSMDGNIQWKSTFFARDSHRLLAEVCIWDLRASVRKYKQKRRLSAGPLTAYSASYWPHHFRLAEYDTSDSVTSSAVYLCEVPSSYAWKEDSVDLEDEELDADNDPHWMSCFEHEDPPLYIASQLGLPGVVEKILHVKKKIKWKDFGTRSPLLAATAGGYTAVVRLLLEAGANPNARTKLKKTSLYLAARDGRDDIVKLLLESNADPNDFQKNTSKTPLARAAEEGHDTIVKYLLQAGADADIRDDKKGTALTLAAKNGHLSVVESLVASGVALDVTDGVRQTPMACAAQRGHGAVVKFLLDSGANPHLKDYARRNVLTWVAQEGELSLVQLLVEKEADVNYKDLQNRTAIMYAARNGHLDVVRFLHEEGADLNLTDRCSRTPLSMAAENGHLSIVKFLVRKEVALDIKSSKRQTALSYAAEGGHSSIVDFLIDNGAGLDITSSQGRTALSLAAGNGHLQTVSSMINWGADLDLKDCEGRTALYHAASQEFPKIVELLMREGADFKIANDNKIDPLLAAILWGKKKCAQLLASASGDVVLDDPEIREMQERFPLPDGYVKSRQKFLAIKKRQAYEREGSADLDQELERLRI